ncbi:MAG: hypothetical protein V4760_13270 [Bdellovibrionota bacterium]
MAQNQMSNINVGDVLKDSLASAMGEVVHALEPQLNDLATRYTHQAIDKSRTLGTAAVTRVRNQPWYLVGAAAILLIGAAIMIGFQSNEDTATA